MNNIRSARDEHSVRLKIEEAKRLLAEGKTRPEACKTSGVAPATLVKYVGRVNRIYRTRAKRRGIAGLKVANISVNPTQDVDLRLTNDSSAFLVTVTFKIPFADFISGMIRRNT